MTIKQLKAKRKLKEMKSRMVSKKSVGKTKSKVTDDSKLVLENKKLKRDIQIIEENLKLKSKMRGLVEEGTDVTSKEDMKYIRKGVNALYDALNYSGYIGDVRTGDRAKDDGIYYGIVGIRKLIDEFLTEYFPTRDEDDSVDYSVVVTEEIEDDEYSVFVTVEKTDFKGTIDEYLREELGWDSYDEQEYYDYIIIGFTKSDYNKVSEFLDDIAVEIETL